MKKISISDFNENIVEIVGKEWMLVTAGDKDGFNTMTASWGGMGQLWHMPVVFVFIRPTRYTFEFTEKFSNISLSFLGEENRGVHRICGFKSGREVNKVAEAGLIPLFTDLGTPYFKQARLVIEAKKVYSDMLKKDRFIDKTLYDKWYSPQRGSLHMVYVAEILNIFVN